MIVPTEALIVECEDRLRTAMLGSDLRLLDELLATELIFTSHEGQLFGKQDDIGAHRSGAIKIDRVTPSDRRIQLRPGIGIVTVRVEIGGLYMGTPLSGTFRFTRVWAPSATGTWQVVAAHSTLLSER